MMHPLEPPAPVVPAVAVVPAVPVVPAVAVVPAVPVVPAVAVVPAVPAGLPPVPPVLLFPPPPPHPITATTAPTMISLVIFPGPFGIANEGRPCMDPPRLQVLTPAGAPSRAARRAFRPPRAPDQIVAVRARRAAGAGRARAGAKSARRPGCLRGRRTPVGRRSRAGCSPDRARAERPARWFATPRGRDG